MTFWEQVAFVTIASGCAILFMAIGYVIGFIKGREQRRP